MTIYGSIEEDFLNHRIINGTTETAWKEKRVLLHSPPAITIEQNFVEQSYGPF
jgi:hypothetical protein